MICHKIAQILIFRLALWEGENFCHPWVTLSMLTPSEMYLSSLNKISNNFLLLLLLPTRPSSITFLWLLCCFVFFKCEIETTFIQANFFISSALCARKKFVYIDANC